MIPIILAVLAVAIAGTVALNWEEIIKALKGKKLAVLGERKAGKTTLIKFLKEGSIPEKYEATNHPEKISGGRFQLKELRLVFKDMIDVPGRREFDWEKTTKDADIVLYLLRVDRLMRGHIPTENRVRKDIEQIKRWLDDHPKNFPLFVIGTHCDLTKPDLTKLQPDQTGDYEDKVREIPVIQKIELLGGGKKKVTLLLGSLKSKDTTEILVYRLLQRILERI